MNDKSYLLNKDNKFVISIHKHDDLEYIIDELLNFIPESYIHPDIFQLNFIPIYISINTSKHYLVNYNSRVEYYIEKISNLTLVTFEKDVTINNIFKSVAFKKPVIHKEQQIEKKVDKQQYKYDKPMELISDLVNSNLEIFNYENIQTDTIVTEIEEAELEINVASLLYTADITYLYSNNSIIDSDSVTIDIKLSNDAVEYMKLTKKSKSRKFIIEFAMFAQSKSDNISSQSCLTISNTKCMPKRGSYTFVYNQETDSYSLVLPISNFDTKLCLIEALIGMYTLTKNKFKDTVLVSNTKPFKINLSINKNKDYNYKLYLLTEAIILFDTGDIVNRFYNGGVIYSKNTIIGSSAFLPSHSFIQFIDFTEKYGSILYGLISEGSKHNSSSKEAIKLKYMNVKIVCTDPNNIRVSFINTDKFFKTFMSNVYINGIGYVFPNRLSTNYTGEMSLGSFISDVCSDTSGTELLINTIKEDLLKDSYVIKCSTDQDSLKISELYSEKMHVTHTKGDLHNSCMRHSTCTQRLQLYDYLQEAGVLRMMYYKQMTSDKIFGRCLVWLHDGEEYYDRFYSAAPFIRDKHMKTQLHKNHYYIKEKQHFKKFSIEITDEIIYDKIVDNLPLDYRVVIKNKGSWSTETKSTSNCIPYMDTVKYITINNVPKTIIISF